MLDGVFGERFSAVDLVLLCVGRLQVADMQLAGSAFFFLFLIFLYSHAVVYISRNPNLSLVARQESSNRDMFFVREREREKKGGQIYSGCCKSPVGCFFFFICLPWVVAPPPPPHPLLLIFVCTCLKKQATLFAGQTDAGAVTTQTQRERHSHQLAMQGLLAVLATQHTRQCAVCTVLRTRCPSGKDEGLAAAASRLDSGKSSFTWGNNCHCAKFKCVTTTADRQLNLAILLNVARWFGDVCFFVFCLFFCSRINIKVYHKSVLERLFFPHLTNLLWVKMEETEYILQAIKEKIFVIAKRFVAPFSAKWALTEQHLKQNYGFWQHLIETPSNCQSNESTYSHSHFFFVCKKTVMETHLVPPLNLAVLSVVITLPANLHSHLQAL